MGENLGNFEYKNDHNSKNKKLEKSENLFFICFSTLRIIHKNRIKTEGGEGGGRVCISLVGKRPNDSMNVCIH